MAEYVSGEQFQAMKRKSPGASKPAMPQNLIGIVVVVVLVAGLSFYAGMVYQKSHQPKTAMALANGFGTGGPGGGLGGRGRFGGQRPTIGPVTAISASSITVQDSRTGSSVTLSVAASTQITDNGQTVTTADIQTGDTVLVTADTTTKTQAARILVNPSFGGGGGGGTSGAGPATSGTSSPSTDQGASPTFTN
jgi:hypothetical protein